MIREPAPSAPHPLELSSEQMRRMVELAMDAITSHLERLRRQPVHATTGGRRLARSLREAVPERGAPFEELLRLLFKRVIPASLSAASPGLLAYVPGGGLFHAAVADLITDATNRHVALDVLECPTCKGRMKLVVMLTEPRSIARFLAALGEPTEVPGRSPRPRCSRARGARREPRETRRRRPERTRRVPASA